MSATETMTVDTAPRPLPSITAHLDALTAMGGEGFLVISSPVPGAGRDGGPGWRAWSFPTTDVDGAAQRAADLDAKGLNVYVRSNLLNRPLTKRTERGKTPDTGCAVALAVDLDVAGASHKPGIRKYPLPPDRAAAMRIIAGLPEPSFLISTGDDNTHGWWMLDEPEHDDPVALIETWADRIVHAGARLGWHVDSPDATRVLRVCGTHRRKPGIEPNLVSMESVAGWPVDGLAVRPWCPTSRYGATDLLEALEPAPPPVAPRAPARPRRPGEFGPADAVARLAWSDILEPLGWTFVGTGRMGHDGPATERWKRPGATSEHSLVAIPDGPAVAFSDACGLPTGAGQKLTKFRVLAALHHAGDEGAAARAVRRSSKGVPA